MAMSDELPKRTTNLNTIPEPYRIAYSRTDKAYALDEVVALAIDGWEAELAEMQAKIDEVRRDHAALVEGIKERSRKSTVRDALLHELAEAGVTGGLAKGAATIIEVENTMVVEDHGLGPVVLAETRYGPFSAQHIVADFLQSEGGEAYRSKRTTPNAGHFASMVADMKRGR